jgi:hypothetical protein
MKSQNRIAAVAVVHTYAAVVVIVAEMMKKMILNYSMSVESGQERKKNKAVDSDNFRRRFLFDYHMNPFYIHLYLYHILYCCVCRRLCCSMPSLYRLYLCPLRDNLHGSHSFYLRQSILSF